MTSELFKEWHAWATDRLSQPRSPAAAHSYEYWLELKVGRLATDKASLEQRVERLEPYLIHGKECRYDPGDEDWDYIPCTCGLMEALASQEEA